MKTIKYIYIALFTFISLNLFSQAPQAFKYQAVARDNGGNLLVNQAVSFRINILSGSTSGTSVYAETHTATTNAYGLVTLNVGAGTLVSGSFSSISWGSNNYFIKIELDPAGGTAYALMGTTQLLSVPYALYAETSGSATGGTTGQDIYEVYGTAQLPVTSATTSYALIPGLTQTITIPSNCEVYVHTDGGIQCTATGSAYSIVDVAIFVDGVVSSQAGVRRIVAANTTGLAQVIENWSFGKSYTLSAGNHTFSVRAVYPSGTGASTANVSSSTAPQLQGVLTVTIINK
ncbi:MAG TPA: hypothetical protein VK177_18700 [Flavobacteriales bacterium]|nr:hypothetical protein [Flavobacteriales bacterium]